MAGKRPHVLLVEAPYYTHIAALLREGAEHALAAGGATFEVVQVPGSFEIPGAIRMADAAGKFDGFVALGCVIRGETSHYDHICESTAEWLQRLAVEHGLPIGYGILTCENEQQALHRANPGGNGRDHGGAAARACLAMIGVKRQFGG
ncbi:MAG TPA: 6,7-dimethyl-8-ribityllumazine synthase [Stellaceae bacterium]|jgi:6,7-dimethyl-8-ribityllumazine synthase|nr:6,7-dimethyl-8-ribityllumazine synthase [Stellaceae bacterium]